MSIITQFVITLFCASVVAAHNLMEKEILQFVVPNEIQEDAPYALSGYDEDGSPIWLIELGEWEMRKYAEMDVGGFNIRQAGDPKTVQFVLRLMQKVEEFGRQKLLKQGWIVNANTLFEGVWRLSTPLLGQKGDAFELYTNNKDLWLPKILKVLPRDQLPEKYGGPPSYKPVKQFG
ncbi:unnamed protein product [Allacma fusca]|uniref:CRAL-TRIO domain-containing protein n=1 Tax=Allacma fusca TaxID=39272 RepID=A0A8J2JUI9_9HEXA|nr:unnamed protein product [Allacma fusca]